MPARVLADTTYATREDIITLAAHEVAVYTPVPTDKAAITAESHRNATGVGTMKRMR